MTWSSHDQYGLFHQSSSLRPQTPQDAALARRLEEARDELQAAYWKSLYPAKVKKIQQEVEKTCDRLDYAGSFLYDEYPDRLNLERAARQICEALRKKQDFYEVPMEELCEGYTAALAPEPKPAKRDDWLEDMVRILFYQEIGRRRSRSGKKRVFREKSL